MANEKTLQTIIVLRNDSSTNWANSEVILKKGETGIAYLDNGNVITKVGDGVNKWADLPQIEPVLEQNVTLTQNFGKYDDVPAGGFKTLEGTAGMTVSEWLLGALKETVEPTITQPNVSFSSATATVENNDSEMGAKITALTWAGTPTTGSYKIGTATQATGLAADDFSWSVSNNIDSQTSTLEDGTFTLTSDKYIQINSESSTTYATISATVTLDVTDVVAPKNNLGEDTNGKITGFDTKGIKTKDISKEVKVTGYRKPFWGVLTTPFAVSEDGTTITLTSDDVRGLPKNGTATKGLPSTLEVAEGARQVIFCAKAGTYTGLTATDSKAQNATVTFTKFANAVQVKGANDYTAVNYDVFAVTWGDPIASAKSLNLSWK